MGTAKTLLVTGGTGTLGHEIIKQAYNVFDSITIISRDEQRQHEMAKEFPRCKFVLGDITHKETIKQAFKDVDFVIHTAAMKHIDIIESAPEMCIEQNLTGTTNIIDCCLENIVVAMLFISSDKSTYPTSVYGASKLIGEKLCVAANNRKQGCRFSVVRSMNIWGSKGSVIPLWEKAASEGRDLCLTDKGMIRHWIKLEDIAAFTLAKLNVMMGGEVFIPPCFKKSMWDIANEIIDRPKGGVTCQQSKIVVIGKRPGEKLEEQLYTQEELEKGITL